MSYAGRVTTGDEALLERWQGGDAEAGNVLFRRHFRSVRRFFRNKVPPDDVEDLIQRTFTGCVEARDRVRGEAGFRAFLFAVARRQLYKFLRDRASHQRRVDVDLGVSSVFELGQTPSSVMAAQQHQQLLLLALQRVSVEHQTMLELYYWEQLPGPEIAEVLGIAPATVRTRLHRGRAALERAFRELLASAPKAPPDAAPDASGLEAALRSAGAEL